MWRIFFLVFFCPVSKINYKFWENKTKNNKYLESFFKSLKLLLRFTQWSLEALENLNFCLIKVKKISTNQLINGNFSELILMLLDFDTVKWDHLTKVAIFSFGKSNFLPSVPNPFESTANYYRFPLVFEIFNGKA